MFILEIILYSIIVLLSLYFFKSNYSEVFYNSQLDNIIIVEPRIHKNIIPIIKNINKNLENIPIIFFHGNKNLEFMKKNFSNEINDNKIKLINLNVDDLNIEEYNLLISSLDFWEKVNGDIILFMEMDSCLCDNPDLKINDFLDYNYVGSPWKNNKSFLDQTDTIGNSGFSLRNKNETIKFIKNNEYKYGTPTDVYFNSIKNKPSHEKSKKFGVEQVFYPNPIGVHKPWKSLSKEDYNILKKNCSCLKDIEDY